MRKRMNDKVLMEDCEYLLPKGKKRMPYCSFHNAELINTGCKGCPDYDVLGTGTTTKEDIIRQQLNLLEEWLK